ncbi:MAG TPA: hypothetical protein VFR81_30000 [Longimicrobium sp.]|nr:hypothetical protein [Longimicrobium sp.]
METGKKKRAASKSTQIVFATVIALREDGTVEVVPDGRDAGLMCDVLEPGVSELGLAPGDSVLVRPAESRSRRSVILGRIARMRAMVRETTPDELVIEAKHSLTLRVGDGSITIREDGRIVIKGKDLVSHARGMNRIRGGSVAIN